MRRGNRGYAFFARGFGCALFIFPKARGEKEKERESEGMKKIVALILALSMVFALCGCGNSSKKDYEKAVSLFNEGSYTEAQTIFKELGDYEDSVSYLEKCEIEEKYAAKKSMNEGDFKAACAKVNREELLRNPEKHIGEYFCFSCEVDDQPSEQNTEMVVWCDTGKSYTGGYFGDKVQIKYREDPNIGRLIREDVIDVWGVFEGLTSFHSMAGTYDVPVFTVYYYSFY